MLRNAFSIIFFFKCLKWATHSSAVIARWECALQCSGIWTAMVNVFLIRSTYTNFALSLTNIILLQPIHCHHQHNYCHKHYHHPPHHIHHQSYCHQHHYHFPHCYIHLNHYHPFHHDEKTFWSSPSQFVMYHAWGCHVFHH